MAYLYNRFCKWVKNNNSWVQMTLWKTNFNMPVPDLWGDVSWWVEWVWVFTYYWVATTFDLSWYNYGWEVIIAVCWIHWEESEWWGNNHTYTQTWKDEFWNVLFINSATINLSILWTWNWREEQLWSNQWVAPWEIDNDGVYSCTVSISWPNINLSTQYNVTFTNVPTFTSFKTPGAMWVQWTDFCYVWYNAFVHRITGLAVWNVWVSKSWHVWENDSALFPSIYYIDQLWEKRTPEWNLEQFASTFSNWAPWPVSWQTPWYIYADQEFWHTHLSHIWYDGKKYLIWDGHYPYQNPY